MIQYEDEEAMLDALMMADIDVRDIEVEDGYMTVTVDPTQLDDAKTAVESLIDGVKFEVLEDKMVPNETVTLSGEDLTLFKRLVTLLEDVDDVQNVYHNVENIDEE